MMKQLFVLISAFILLLPGSGAAAPLPAPATIDLGPFSIALAHPDQWNASMNSQVNHGAQFIHKQSGDRIIFSFRVITGYETGMEKPEHNPSQHIRYYQFHEAQRLVLVFDYETDVQEAEESVGYSDFLNLVSSARLNANYQMSSCLRWGKVWSQFQEFAAAKRVSNDIDAIDRYGAELKREIEKEIASGGKSGHSCGALYYLLGNLYCFNKNWEFLGRGFNRQKARYYFEAALALRPESSEIVQALRNIGSNLKQ
ncbi:MAG: hypothetical protein HY586_08125 [Candidatus Omnitrophica bacterium]|nr:hypothetical protein [Candidatus Omnitrophota bacterium]